MIGPRGKLKNMNCCFKDLNSRKIFRLIIKVIIVLIVLIVVFQAGRFVGLRQAIFSGRLGDNYYRALEGPGRFGSMGPMADRGFFDNLPNSHGAVGQIIKFDLPTLVVTGPDNLEKIILKINL